MFRTAAKLALNAYVGKIASYRGILERTQWLPPDDLVDLQQKKLSRLIDHAYRNVPYYHRVFAERGITQDDIVTIDDLIKLPILRKTDIGRNAADLLAANLREERIPRYTGGTTAFPMKFYRTKEELRWSLAAQFRAYGWGGYELGDKYAHIWPAYSELSASRFKIRNVLERRKPILDATNLSEKTISVFLDKIQRSRPQFLIGYSSCIYMLSRFLMSKHLTPPTFKAIFTSSETLLRNHRKTIEDVFACDVYDHYNTREFTSVACECKEGMGYHISSENLVVETVKQGQSVGPDENGEVLITSLNNYGMPFIRYSLGDIARLSSKGCTCGRGLPLIGSIEGRTYEFFKVGDGSLVGIRDLAVFFEDLPVNMFTIEQVTANEILVKVVKENDFGPKHVDFIARNLAWGNPRLKVKVEAVESLPSTMSGKRPYFISKLGTYDWMNLDSP